MIPLRSAFRRLLAPPFVTLLAGLLASCGGGGGDGQAPSSLQVLLSDGDTLPGGFVIDTIESANMANDQTIALIASQPGTPSLGGVFLRDPGGGISPILTPSSPLPEGLSLTTVKNLVISSAGDVSFEVGDRLDDDALFLFTGGRLSLVARTDPGATPPGFRILGERRIANGGKIAFSDGVSPCTVDTSGGSERITCTLEVYEGFADGVRKVGLPVELDDESTTSVSVVMNDGGQVALGLPGRSRQSLVGFVIDGGYQSLITRGDDIPGLGRVLSAKPRAIDAGGDLVVDARFDTDGDSEIDRDHVLVARGGQLVEVARTGVPAGTKVVLGVRGEAIDDFGRVVFSATYGDPGSTGGLISLRVWENGVTQEIAFEGQDFGKDENDEDVKILEIEQIRVAGRGDVVFRAKIGFVEDGTQHISDNRVLRWADGGLVTLVKTGQKVQTGAIVELSIADLNDGGDLLLIAGVRAKTNRALLLLPRQ